MLRFWVWAALGVTSLVGCSSAETGGRPVPSSEPDPAEELPACALGANYTRCDITATYCQEHMMELTACVMEVEPIDGLTIDLISQDEYATLVTEDLVDYQPEDWRHSTQALSVLRLSPPFASTKEDIVTSRVERVLGEYRPQEKRLVVVDHGEDFNSIEVDAVLVHEMVHALQDADFDLYSWYENLPTTYDGSLASRSVVEGGARFYEYRVVFPMAGLDLSTAGFDSTLQEWLDAMLDAVAEDPWSGDSFPYDFGVVQAWQAWQDGKSRGTDRLFASPPATTLQVMTTALGMDMPELADELLDPDIEGLVLHEGESLGAWGLYLFLLANGVSPEESLTRALAWRGDRLSIYTDDSNEPTYALWQIELGLPEDASAVDGAHSDFLSNLEHGTQGSRVFASFRAGASVTPAPELTASGKAWIAE